MLARLQQMVDVTWKMSQLRGYFVSPIRSDYSTSGEL